MNSQAEAMTRAGPPAHERVYRRLREMILFGELEPGQAVTIQGLVEDLGAGMTPVREALRRLTAEGALAALGNRRIVVPELTSDASRELFGLRTALEPALAVGAATWATAGDIDRLEAIDATLDLAIERGDVGGYLRANHAFHADLNTLSRMPIHTALVEGLWLRFGPSLRVVCGQVGTRNLPDRHKELIAAMRAGDKAAAQEAMAQDVSQGMDLISSGLFDGH